MVVLRLNIFYFCCAADLRRSISKMCDTLIVLFWDDRTLKQARWYFYSIFLNFASLSLASVLASAAVSRDWWALRRVVMHRESAGRLIPSICF